MRFVSGVVVHQILIIRSYQLTASVTGVQASHKWAEGDCCTFNELDSAKLFIVYSVIKGHLGVVSFHLQTIENVLCHVIL